MQNLDYQGMRIVFFRKSCVYDGVFCENNFDILRLKTVFLK